MSVSERPGVYSSYEVTSALYGSGNGRAIGIAAVAFSGEKGKVSLVNSYSEAAAVFGAGSDLTELIRLLFLNGAPRVYAVPAAVSAEAVRADYEAAFAALMERPEVGYMVCDSQDQSVHSAMLSAIKGGDEQSKYRIGVVEGAGSTETLCTHASALNSERMVLVGSSVANGVPGSAAAAVAGVLAGQTDPALPLGGAAVTGLGALSVQFSDHEVNTLIQGGVTLLERLGDTVTVIRGVTTRTSTNGVSDNTWRDLTTILIVDDVLPTVRDSLKSRFARSKNTEQSRGAIRTQVIIELENKLASEVIDGYSGVSVAADANDPSVCNVSFAFDVVHGLNRIQLVAHITV